MAQEQSQLPFGKVVEIIPLSPKVDLVVKATKDEIFLSKYVKTASYTGWGKTMELPKTVVEQLIKALVKATTV